MAVTDKDAFLDAQAMASILLEACGWPRERLQVMSKARKGRLDKTLCSYGLRSKSVFHKSTSMADKIF
jgi:hypothetical protein